MERHHIWRRIESTNKLSCRLVYAAQLLLSTVEEHLVQKHIVSVFASKGVLESWTVPSCCLAWCVWIKKNIIVVAVKWMLFPNTQTGIPCPVTKVSGRNHRNMYSTAFRLICFVQYVTVWSCSRDMRGIADRTKPHIRDKQNSKANCSCTSNPQLCSTNSVKHFCLVMCSRRRKISDCDRAKIRTRKPAGTAVLVRPWKNLSMHCSILVQAVQTGRHRKRYFSDQCTPTLSRPATISGHTWNHRSILCWLVTPHVTPRLAAYCY